MTAGILAFRIRSCDATSGAQCTRRMRTPEEIANDFHGRRAGILRALVTEVDAFYDSCDPERENLCLYGNPDGTWEVALPAEEVPPEMPEPSLGINFARNGMQVRWQLRRSLTSFGVRAPATA